MDDKWWQKLTLPLARWAKKVWIYCLDPKYEAFAYWPVSWSSPDGRFSPEQIACYIGSVEKKIFVNENSVIQTNIQENWSNETWKALDLT